ncbi:hypothetical protein [Nonlabens antarcticus]|uniref:hypothetical protein n=1 Tax=Nonlabens antarcticus TaxID=392714 RepID=UPI001891BDEA|nr:hypothetical protein [Nonlabens antarcticus]
MKSIYLFPHTFKKIGLFLFLPCFMLLILFQFYDSPSFMEFTIWTPITDDFLTKTNPTHWIKNNLTDEILSITAIIGGLFIAFSKEKQEDELINEVRKSSLIWAVYVNYGFYILMTILVYGFDFLNVLLLNVFTLLIVFIVRFEWYKNKLKSSMDDE